MTACRNGMCDPPPPIEPTGAAGTGGSTTGAAGTTGAGGTGTFLGTAGTSGGAGRGGSSGGTSGSAVDGGPGLQQPQRVCGCAVPDGPGGGAAMVLLVWLARSRRRGARPPRM
jgi:MYXO-CTERM domain-containing protein